MKQLLLLPLVLVGFLFAMTACMEDSVEEDLPEPVPRVPVQETNIIRIPVVVHVIHNGEPVGTGPNINQAQVQSQIEVLNEDFRRKVGTNGFNDHPEGADTEIEFFLATEAPDGRRMAEPGIDRVDGGRNSWPKGPFRNPIDNSVKPQTIWPPDRYFNIWTVNFGGFVSRDLLGYAQFPSNSGLPGLNVNGGSASTDGIVVGYKYFGSSDKGNFPDLWAPFDKGRTTTHEVGHWLGLRHIWGDGDCTVDDFCTDTPNVGEPNIGCPMGARSCGELSMIENYMDYTDDACMNVFTQDQKQRMLTVLRNSPRRREFSE
ncbi:MAG: zinc metalloprotease [Bacteroidota bacterium]